MPSSYKDGMSYAELIQGRNELCRAHPRTGRARPSSYNDEMSYAELIQGRNELCRAHTRTK